MAVNLASKYEKKVDERFKLKSLTEAAVNQDYTWEGVSTINVYDIPTAQMNDYRTTGANRYGDPVELQNTVTPYTVSKDRSFTFTIDRKNYQDTQMVMAAGKALARQNDEVVVPEIDTYRLAAMATAAVAAGGTDTAAITKSNAYTSFLAMMEYFADNKVPLNKIIAFVTPAFYSCIKLDSSFIQASDIGQKMLINGQVGEIDGARIVRAPTIYFPAKTSFIGCHPRATVAPKKLQEYKIHDNPPGINGWLVEGRIRYDAFVLKSKAKAVYAHKTP